MLSLGGLRQGSVDSLDLKCRITYSVFDKVLSTACMLLSFFGKVSSLCIINVPVTAILNSGVSFIIRQEAQVKAAYIVEKNATFRVKHIPA